MKKPNVVNLHFIDYCNYKCVYCFVEKENRMLSYENCVIIIDNIKRYFDTNKLKGRINLVGGETFICEYLQDIIDYINSKGIEVSIVTNGSMLTRKFLEYNKGKIQMIGLSIDSLNEDTNLKIGRCCGNYTISEEEAMNLCKTIKELGIKLKINHCLSKYNVSEDITQFIEKIKPDRFKVLQMKIVDGINSCCKNMQLSDTEFKNAVEKYKPYCGIVESCSDMCNSYLSINSKGELYDNENNCAYGNLIDEDLNFIVNKIEFNLSSFLKRY